MRNNGFDKIKFEALTCIVFYRDLSLKFPAQALELTDVDRARAMHDFLDMKMSIFATLHANTDFDEVDFLDAIIEFWDKYCEPELIK